MTVRVLFFAQLREATGSAELAVELAAGATLEDLRRRLTADRPALAAALGRLPAVVNRRVVRGPHPLADGDEVAWLPPVAGGAGSPAGEVVEARLTRAPIDPQALAQAVAAPGAGAIALFLGVVRDHEGKRAVERLEYEAYEALAGERLAAVAREALARWPGTRLAVVHRLGTLEVGEVSVAVAVASAHRAAAFECCRHVIERLKHSIPIWKKSFGPAGAAWVEGAPYEEGP